MDILKYYRDRWLITNSKGIWTDASGHREYIENLTDKHLCSLPHFLYKRNKVNSINDIPKAILDELKDRGFGVDKKNEYKTYKLLMPKVKETKATRPIIPKFKKSAKESVKDIQQKRNRNLLSR